MQILSSFSQSTTYQAPAARGTCAATRSPPRRACACPAPASAFKAGHALQSCKSAQVGGAKVLREAPMKGPQDSGRAAAGTNAGCWLRRALRSALVSHLCRGNYAARQWRGSAPVVVTTRSRRPGGNGMGLHHHRGRRASPPVADRRVSLRRCMHAWAEGCVSESAQALVNSSSARISGASDRCAGGCWVMAVQKWPACRGSSRTICAPGRVTTCGLR